VKTLTQPLTGSARTITISNERYGARVKEMSVSDQPFSFLRTNLRESVVTWRTDVVAKFIDALGLEKIMFETADPEVFAWYIKNYGPEVNLFVDHSQIVQLECLRSGIRGTKSLGPSG
jgi:phosphosulfolactate synthase (CoM biosynthesis protein A)